MNLKRSLGSRDNWVQFVKFGVVGGSGFLVNMLVALVMNRAHGGTAHADDALFEVWGLKFSFSMLVWIVAFVIANFVNFQLNRSWTFRAVDHRSWWREFWPFFGIGAAAALVGLFIKPELKRPGSPFYLPAPYFHEGRGLVSREYWSQIITIFATMPINFVFNKLFTFVAVKGRHHGEEDELDIPLVAPVVAPELVDDTGEIRALPDGAEQPAPVRRRADGAESEGATAAPRSSRSEQPKA